MDEHHFEHADRITQAARDAAVERARRQSQAAGQAECDDCGDEIPADRRQACPWAIRCIHCQSAFERLQTLSTTNR